MNTGTPLAPNQRDYYRPLFRNLVYAALGDRACKSTFGCRIGCSGRGQCGSSY